MIGYSEVTVVKKIWKSPWTIAIVSAFLAPIATIIIDAIMKKPFLSTLWSVIRTLWSWIITFLTFDLKVWWVLLGICVIIGIFFVIAKISDAKQEDKEPEFLSYKNDTFCSWKWSWEWQLFNRDKKWHVVNLKAHCPKCDTPMFHDSYETSFQCPRCNYQSRYGEEHKRSQEVEAIIIDNLN